MRARHLVLVSLVTLLACGGSNKAADDDGGDDDDTPPPTCNIAECESGQARTCDGELGLSCSSIGASCETFDTPEGGSFGWCGCGNLTAAGQCTGTREGVACADGLAQLFECPAGTTCDVSGAQPACACDGVADGVCPDAACTNDADCQSCTPSCAGKECGDNGCGGSCGTCDFTQTCNAQDQCVSACTPSCAGKECGPDGCGGTCAPGCSGGETCSAAGQCEMGGPDCFFEHVSLKLVADPQAFTDVNYCTVTFTQHDADGTPRSVVLTVDRSFQPDLESVANSCAYDLTSSVTCSMAGGVMCTGSGGTYQGSKDELGDPATFEVHASFADGGTSSCFVVMNLQ